VICAPHAHPQQQPSTDALPRPTGFVNDFAGVIPGPYAERIEATAGNLKSRTGVEIAVVTVDTIEPWGSIEEYSIALASEWGIGQRDEDTGALILLAMQERRLRIEIGYGLEGMIPDGLAGEIMDRSIIPSLKAGDYGAGLLKGVQAIAGIVAQEYGIELDTRSMEEGRTYTAEGGGGGLLFLAVILLFFLIGGGRFLFPLLFFGAASRRGFYGGGFGTGRSTFGGGSSFGGFGGGSFGGGGASRGF
jgi:uncharacterized protein